MIILLFIVGLILGSFYNVVGLRIPQNQSIAAPRSCCPHCKHTLSPLELIPVLSYIFLGGKCRRCRAPVSALYPAVELSTGILFAAAPLIIGWNVELLVAWTLISLMVIIFVSDFKYMIIPDKVLLFFAAILIAERIFIPLSPWWDSVAGTALGFFLLLLIAVISKGGMGGGDIKLYAVIGIALGVKLVFLSFFLATLLGAVLGGLGMLLGIMQKGKPIPFGPFIGIGTLIAYFYGSELIEWYFNSFL
ncbi:prepilin peptidase [Sporosarcina globispora]|uniref:Prepilin peptidase n=1 Tax=Sporosarcina globispora TaxID=1459 RepID=A0A0M0GAS4_SPOGL|nr:A24 family peptidase [Sporosarcina globispora]KON86883.1 prepilin peptidase [Sporosarcina globispora]